MLARAPSTAAAGLDVHGLRIAIEGDWPELVEELRLDFAWFATPPPAGADVTVTVERRAPDYGAFGNLPAAFVTPRNVVYQDGERNVVDYFGQALSVYDRRAGTLRIQGEAKHLVHQAAYLFLLSRVGEHVDAAGLPRLHALGLSGAQGAVAVLLPSGGGKSTLGLRALREDGVKLLSEDSPLIDVHGRVHPFPLRIGVNPTDAARLPDGHVREIERLEFHPKLVLDLEAFADRIEGTPQPLRHIVVGQRTLGDAAELAPVPRRRLAGTLLRECVVGVGLYQGMEFILQRGLRDLPGKTRPVATRTACCAAALARARTWTLTTGRDHERNWAALLPLLS
jgi:hypothetical protein